MFNTVPLQMELDTGASVSLLSYRDYEKHFKHIPLEPAAQTFQGYTGTHLKLAGHLSADVEYKGQKVTLPLYVVHTDDYQPALFGRNWMKAIRLD